MSKIIGVTVGTPISAQKIVDDLKPVKSVNGKTPDENGNVDIEAGGGSSVEIDTTLKESGKAADAKAVGDALGKKLDKSGGTVSGNLTVAGNLIIPFGTKGIRDNTDVPVMRYETIGEEQCLRIGNVGKRVYFYSSDRPLYNGNKIALSSEIPTDEHINGLISTALGVIENGTY
jgi:hypothetical protein